MDRRLAALAIVGLLLLGTVAALMSIAPPQAEQDVETPTPTATPAPEPSKTDTPTATPTPEPSSGGDRDATPEGELEPGDPGYKPVIRNGSATGSGGDDPVVGVEAVANATVS